MIVRILAGALVASLLGSGWLYVANAALRAELALERQQREMALRKEAADWAAKLSAAAERSDELHAVAEQRAVALERSNQELIRQVEVIRDYQDRLAESLRLFINGMLRGTSGESRLSPDPAAVAGAGSSSASRTAGGRY